MDSKKISYAAARFLPVIFAAALVVGFPYTKMGRRLLSGIGYFSDTKNNADLYENYANRTTYADYGRNGILDIVCKDIVKRFYTERKCYTLNTDLKSVAPDLDSDPCTYRPIDRNSDEARNFQKEFEAAKRTYEETNQ